MRNRLLIGAAAWHELRTEQHNHHHDYSAERHYDHAPDHDHALGQNDDHHDASPSSPPHRLVAQPHDDDAYPFAHDA